MQQHSRAHHDRWLTRRRAAAALEAAVILGLPFLTIHGQSALRFDIPSLTLFAFGAEIPISQFLSVLLIMLFLGVLFIGITTVFGRIWCGWLCPQSVLEEFAEDLSSAINRKHRLLIKRLILVPVSALVSVSMIWYFIPPAGSLDAIASGGAAMWFFIVMALAIYAMLALLGRRFCATVCPYSMLQSAFFDRDTVVVGFDPARADECMGCEMCVKSCPMGIDIRRGLQRECIACARCIDACETMRRGLPPLVRYMGRPLRAKAAVWAAAAALFALAAIVAVGARPSAEVTFYRNAVQPAKGHVNTYTYSIRNNTSAPLDFTVVPGPPFEVVGGAVEVMVLPAERANGIIVLSPAGPATSVRVTFRARGVEITKEAGYL